MAGRGPLNYTTSIDAAKTAAECVGLLARHGASQTSIDWAAGEPVGIAFRLETPAGIRFYTLSASPDRVQKVLDRAFKTGRIKGGYRDHDQALRVAWRVVKDWLEAQLALIEAAVVDLEQVMLPYLVVDEVGTTVYQRYLDQGRKAITG